MLTEARGTELVSHAIIKILQIAATKNESIMDPLTAVGLATNILTFLETGAKLVTGAIEIYGSPSGLTSENQALEAIVTDMRNVCSKLQLSDKDELSSEERSLMNLAIDCDSLCKEIIELVEKTRPKDPKSSLASMRASLKLRWYEQHRRQLAQRLGDCRAQMSLHMAYLSGSHIKDKLEGLIMSAQRNSSRLERLFNQLDSLRNTTTTTTDFTAATQNQINTLHNMTEYASDFAALQCILRSLEFPEMHGRYDSVADAHSETLQWVFRHPHESDHLNKASADSLDAIAEIGGDEDSEKVDHEKCVARNLLHSWLRSGSGIFHVCGKLGCGKSTLMKYISEHPDTKEMLHIWAGECIVGSSSHEQCTMAYNYFLLPGDRKLIHANFFFWKPGSVLQKSLAGLLRCLLHTILAANTDLASKLFPNHWAQAKLVPWQTVQSIRISDKDIRHGFEKLISNPTSHNDSSFCFFIDGLDEFAGTIQHDTEYLVGQLCSWTARAPDRVKLCVSSREYNVFMNTFPEENRIRLHRLSLSDMKRFVFKQLAHATKEAEAMQIAEAVSSSADGIFLWAAVVTKAIREQIQDGTSFENILREIELLPGELEDLFTHLLSSLPGYKLKKAFQVFSLVSLPSVICPGPEHPAAMSSRILHQDRWWFFTLLTTSFLKIYNRDNSFALQEDFSPGDPSSLTERVSLAMKELNGFCKGLVDVVTVKKHDRVRHEVRDNFKNLEELAKNPLFRHSIAFTHRSVPEFLALYTRNSRVQTLIGDFNPLEAYSQLKLAELRAYPEEIGSRGEFEPLVSIRATEGLDRKSFTFLDALSRAVLQARQLLPNAIQDSEYWHDRTRQFGLFINSVQDGRIRPQPDGYFLWPKQDFGSVTPQLPVYSATAHGNLEYLRWVVSQTLIKRDPISLQVLLYCIMEFIHTEHDGSGFEQKVLDAVKFILETGLATGELHPNNPAHVTTTDRDGLLSELRKNPGVDITIWQWFLLMSSRPLDLFGTYHSIIGLVLQFYVEKAQPDLSFRFSVTENAKKKRGSQGDVCMLTVFRHEGKPIALKLLRGGDWHIGKSGGLIEYLEHFKFLFPDWERFKMIVEDRLKQYSEPVEMITPRAGSDIPVGTPVDDLGVHIEATEEPEEQTAPETHLASPASVISIYSMSAGLLFLGKPGVAIAILSPHLAC